MRIPLVILLISTCFGVSAQQLLSVETVHSPFSYPNAKTTFSDDGNRFLLYGKYNGDSLFFNSDFIFENKGKDSTDWHKESFIINFDSNKNILWKKKIRGNGGWKTVIINECKITSAGNTVILGNFNADTLLFDHIHKAIGSFYTNTFVAMLDIKGNLKWLKTIETVADNSHLDVDSDGNIFLALNCDYHDAIFEGDTLKSKLPGIHNTDILLLMLTSAGEKAWWKRLGGLSFDYAWDIAVAPDKSIYLPGSFNSKYFPIENDTLFNNYPAWITSLDLFLLKFDYEGNLVWKLQSDCPNSEYSRAIGFDKWGDLYLACNYDGYFVSIGTDTLYNPSINQNFFVLKVSPDGQVIWMRQPYTEDSAGAFDLAIPSDGEGAYLTAGFTDDIILADSSFRNTGEVDGLIMKINPGGVFNWAKHLEGNAYDQPLSIATGGDNLIVIAGDFNSDTLFCDGEYSPNRALNEPWNYSNGFLMTLRDTTLAPQPVPCPNEMILFPNPVSDGILHVRPKRLVEAIQIHDTMGRLVAVQKGCVSYREDFFRVELPDLITGVYFLSVLSEECGWETSKILVL